MKEERYNIDLKESTKTGKILRIVLGIICLIATAWFLFTITGTAASITTAWIAIAFLFLFSFWLIVSGLGITDRYITVRDDAIIVKQNFLKAPAVFTPSTLNYIAFQPLVIEFRTAGGNMILRLGTYYPGQSASIMEAVETFCIKNGIKIIGLESEDKTES